MKILIIEDEPLAQEELARQIKKHFPDFQIVGMIDSVKDSINWLRNNHTDLIFMDIQLADGISFSIFEHVEIVVPIIFTTAYDQYAIQAFQVNGIGYLLKPINEQELVKAVKKLDLLNFKSYTEKSILNLISNNIGKTYKSRIVSRSGDKILSIDVKDVAYFYAEDKIAFIVTNAGKRHIVDYSLDNLESTLDPSIFFRITRNCIASITSIKNVSKFFNSRLKIKLTPDFEGELLVSRVRVSDFIKWLDGSV